MATGNAIGKTYEALFDLSTDGYYKRGLLLPVVNYPKIQITRFPNARVIGKAASDRSLTLKGGVVCHLDVKSWANKDTHSYAFISDNEATHKDRQRRKAQYNWMLEARRFTPLVFYAACWRWSDVEEWRFHNVSTVTVNEHGLVFNREAGLYIPSPNSIPDWLPVIMHHAREFTIHADN